MRPYRTAVGSSQSKLRYGYKLLAVGKRLPVGTLSSVYPAGSLFAVAKYPFVGFTPRGSSGSGTQQVLGAGFAAQALLPPHSADPSPGSGNHGASDAEIQLRRGTSA